MMTSWRWVYQRALNDDEILRYVCDVVDLLEIQQPLDDCIHSFAAKDVLGKPAELGDDLIVALRRHQIVPIAAGLSDQPLAAFHNDGDSHAVPWWNAVMRPGEFIVLDNRDLLHKRAQLRVPQMRVVERARRQRALD